MKSEHRHELQRNELAAFLNNLPETIKRNQKMIIYVVVVAILVIISAYMTMYRGKIEKVQEQAVLTNTLNQENSIKYKIAQERSQGVDNSMLLTTEASKIKGMAADVDNDLLKAIANIEAGDMVRAELIYKATEPEQAVIEHNITMAKDYYNQAFALAKKDDNLQAIAKFGLGLCEEELGNFDAAGKIYGEIVENQAYSISPAQVYAKQRLAAMVDYQDDVVFLPAPVVVEPEPMSEEMTPDVNIGGVLEQLNVTPEDSNAS